MEISTDYLEKTTLVIFDFGENPEEVVPEGCEILSRTEPSVYKGFTNMGVLIYKLPLDK